MNWHDRMTCHPGVLGDMPFMKGDRLAIEKVVEPMAVGWSEAQIIENSPGITHDDVAACLVYASDVLKSERVIPFPAPSGSRQAGRLGSPAFGTAGIHPASRCRPARS